MRVVYPLAQIIEWHGKPVAIRSDSGLEYVSKTLRNWAAKNNIELAYIQPGNPQQNAYVENATIEP
ncbi:MAG: hypothetical protein AB2990_06465 [Candidatus Symbiodolus clandestinus]